MIGRTLVSISTTSVLGSLSGWRSHIRGLYRTLRWTRSILVCLFVVDVRDSHLFVSHFMMCRAPSEHRYALHCAAPIPGSIPASVLNKRTFNLKRFHLFSNYGTAGFSSAGGSGKSNERVMNGRCSCLKAGRRRRSGLLLTTLGGLDGEPQ